MAPVDHPTLWDGKAAQRIAAILAAYAAHPERFVRKMPVPLALPEAAWINKPQSVEHSDEARH